MKTPITTCVIVSLFAISQIGSIPLNAQEAQDSTPPGSQPTPASSPGCPVKHGRGHDREWLAALNDQERSQLKAAMKKVKNDPQLVASREAVKDAQTKEAKRAAHDTLRQKRRDFLLKADPSLAPVLEKIKEAKSATTPLS